jgi:proline dehydrogenase
MLRRLLLYLSEAAWARRWVTRWGAARTLARRFVAGETLDDAMSATHALNRKGLLVSLDFLGESVRDAKDTELVVKTYRDLLRRIADEGAQASISLKLTHLGLDISEDLCITNLRHILGDAKAHDIPVTIDMESSAYTERTLRIYRTLRDEYDFANVGTVIQAYLRRTPDDMRELASEGAHIRLCKGAYLEPETVALPVKADVDQQYIDVMEAYLKTPGSAYLCIATHDERMIQYGEKLLKEHQAMAGRSEFQMLYGIRAARQEALAAAGFPMRVYLPFGDAWYPYFMRRLAERPANLWFFVKSLVGN